MSKLLILLMIFTLTACSGDSDKLKDDSSSSDVNNIVRIDNIDNQVIARVANEELVDIEVGPVKNSSGDVVEGGQQFKISSSDSSVMFDGTNGLESEVIVKSNSGKFNFKAKIPTIAKQYSIQVQGIGLESSVGFIYVQVKPDEIFSLGEVTSEVFEDTAPFNKIKDAEEKYAIVKNTPVNISIGPIVDKWGNYIQEGRVDAIVKRGLFLDKLDENGNATNKARVDIIGGFARFTAITDLAEGTTFVGAKFGGPEDLALLEAIDLIDEDDPALEGIISSRDELVILQSILNVNSDLDYGVVFIGEEKTRTITLQNLGNTPIYNRTTIVDAPFDKQNGTCLGKATLLPLEACTIEVVFDAQIRIFAVGQVYINGTYNGQELEEQVFQAEAQASLPPNLEFDIEDNIIIFESTPVGDLVSYSFSIINTGDVSASNIQLVAPPAYGGTSESYYVFRSPPETVPNDDPSLGKHCGQEFQPQVRCRVYVDFLPKSKVPNDILGGTLVYEGGDPISIFVKGKSYVNNFEQNIKISSITNKINKDEIESVEIVVGPIRDIFGAVVPDQNVFITVFSEEDTDNGIVKTPVGEVTSPNQILGGPPGVIVIRTDLNGYANFDLKSRIKDEVGSFVVQAEIIDEDSNVLASGVSDYEFIGAKLEFELNTYNFLTAIVGNEKLFTARLENNGSLDAKNIRVYIENSSPEYDIKNEGDCAGVLSGTLNLDIGESCEMTLGFIPSARFNFFDQLNIESATIGNKLYSTLFGKGINPATLNSFDSKIVGTHVIQGQNLSGEISFNNVGDESAENFTIRALSENDSFNFVFDECVNNFLEPGQRCSVNYEYNPESIPQQELITEIEIKAYGAQAGNPTSINIPIEITHSSVVFSSIERGINLHDCFPLEIKGFDTSDNLLDFSNDIVLDLLTDGVGRFYADSNCSSETTVALMPANSFVTNPFFYKTDIGGTTDVLSATSGELATARKSFIIYKDPISFKIVSGDSQSGETEKTLKNPLVIQTIDEDKNGIPNIPVYVDILTDISKEVQYVQNPSFNNDIDGWVVEKGTAEWFRGAGASLKIVSQDEITEVKSFPILADPNTTYNYSIKVAEATGLAEASHIIATLEDGDGNVLQTNIVEGVNTRVFTYTTNNEITDLFLRLKTAGKTPGTIVYIDSVFFTEELPKAIGSELAFGKIPNEVPLITSTEDLGQASFNYEAGVLPLIPIFKVYSDYVSLHGKSVLMNAVTDYPTNIKGELGDLSLTAAGPSLVKNGGDNLGRLSSIEGYHWDEVRKKLILPTGKIYDFNSLKIDPGVDLIFQPKYEEANGDETTTNSWTQVYTKQACQIDGNIRVSGIYTDGEEDIVKMVGLDSEIFEVTSPSYFIGGSSGTGYSSIDGFSREQEYLNTNKTHIFFENIHGVNVYLNGTITIRDKDYLGYIENVNIYVGDILVKKVAGIERGLPLNINLKNVPIKHGQSVRAVWFGGGNNAKISMNVDVRKFNNSTAGRGGGGGYFRIERSRSCEDNKGTISCGNWTSWQLQYTNGAPYNRVFAGQGGTDIVNSRRKSGNGAPGRPGIRPGVSTNNSRNFAPGIAWGGGSGTRGSDGGNLFLHCYASMNGTGLINVAGVSGSPGGNGQNGSYSDTSSSCVSTGVGGNCTRQRYYRRANGGGGAGNGGGGGHGGNLIIKSRIFNHTLSFDWSQGRGGTSGDKGHFWSSWGNHDSGGDGTDGVDGYEGSCKAFDSISNEEFSCN